MSKFQPLADGDRKSCTIFLFLKRSIKNVLGILSAKHNTQFTVTTARQQSKFCPLCLVEKAEGGGDGGG